MVGRRVEVVSLAGRTGWYEGDGADVGELRRKISEREGVPADLLRLTSAGRDLSDGAGLPADMAVRVMLRLLGGKGGFGAMLRTAGAKGIKTTNFDACRDLNGRRLRHVNGEEKLREWEQQAEARKLKKQQELADAKESKKPTPVARFDDDEYEEQLEAQRARVMESVAAAASAGAGAGGSSSDDTTARAGGTAGSSTLSKAEGKRRAGDAAEAPEPKLAKVWADPLAGMVGGSGSSSEESGDDADGA